MFAYGVQALVGCILFILPSLTQASSTPSPYPSACASRVFEFGAAGYSLENLAVRSNGKVLFTPSFPAAAVYEVDPSIGNSSFKVVVNNTQLNGNKFSLGITEIYPDVFAIASGTVNQTGTFKIHTADFNAPGGVVVKQTNAVDDATLLNGMAALPQEPGVLLVSDSYIGRVLRVDTTTGKHSVALNGTAYQTYPGASGAQALLGVNGIRLLGNYLYFINSGLRLFSRVAISKDGYATSSPQVIANLTGIQALPDDFAITPSATAYIAGSDEIVTVNGRGSISVLVGGPNVSTVAGDTSAQLGRAKYNNTLFVTSGIKPVNGVAQVPGYVEALRLDCM